MNSPQVLEFKKDLPNRRITVTRYFNSSLENVWKAWTERDLLDQWWAPKPWRTVTKSMEFEPGGEWIYAMVGPDDTRHWCKIAYSSIQTLTCFEGLDTFCFENGFRNPELPEMHWKVSFFPSGNATKVVIEIQFDILADLEKIVEMGFEEGFTSALSNLDEIFIQQI